MNTKTILCYGDSNTWGFVPGTAERYPRSVRWPGVLERELGDGYEVIAEALNGRTTVWDDPIKGFHNGKEYLGPCLESHRPLDLVVVLLGTNDLKKRFSLSPHCVALGAGVLVKLVQKSEAGRGGAPPKILLVAPPPFGRLSDFADQFDGAEAKSRHLGRRFRAVAEELGCPFLDAAEYVVSSDVDGIHWDASEHDKLGRAVAQRVRSLLG